MSPDVLLPLAALGFTVAGIGGIVRLYLVVNRWPSATGKVVASARRLDTRWGNARYANFALISFRAADGGTYEVQGDYGRRYPWQIGETVSLRYDPTDPNKTTNLPRWQRLALPSTFVFFAVLCWIAWFR